MGVTQTVSFGSNGGTLTHPYTGTCLWGVLGNCGVVVDPQVQNDILGQRVVATGAELPVDLRATYMVGYNAGARCRNHLHHFP